MTEGALPLPFSVAWTEPITLVSIESATFASRLRTRSATPTSVPVTEGVSSIFFKNFLSTLAIIGSSHI